MTIYASKSKPEIEFQNNGRPFSENGSSFISVVDWCISSKFGRQIDFHLLEQIPSLNLNPEVHFRLYAAIFKNRYDVITPPPILLSLRNLEDRWHADDYTYVKIETGNGNPIWRQSVFLNRGLRYFIEIWFGNRFPTPQTGVTNGNSIKYCRKTANINVKKLLFYNKCKAHRSWHI